MAATDLERLVVQLSADFKGYERGVSRARGVTNREFSAIERRAQSMNRNLDNIGKGFGRGLIAPLAGVGAALTVAEVIKYADAWKQAGNALKVSGVPAEKMTATLDRLFNIAQGAGADLGATVTLFSRLSQSAGELGATEEQLFKFTTGIGDALKVAGTDAGAASGALLQLSQALGGAVVHAEEFNSINEGARPILQAVANGMDKAGGSVSKLRAMVLDGNVTSKEFFAAFLKGSGELAKQAASASTTFGQAFQKIENAFTKYIGQTDESLGASRRLIVGLEALANNFGTVADVAINFASILAAGLLGRSIGKMVASFGLGIAALKKFMDALKAAQGVARTGILLGGLGSAAGPIGAAIAVGATAATIALGYLASKAEEAAERSKRVNEQLETMGLLANEAAPKVEEVAKSLDQMSKGDVARSLADINAEIDRLRSGGGFSSLGDELGSIAEKARAQTRGLVGLFSTSAIDKGGLDQIARLADDIANGNIAAEDALATLKEMEKTEISKPVLDLNKQLQFTITRFQAAQLGASKLGDTKQLDTYREAVKKAGDEAVALFDNLLSTMDRTGVSADTITQLETLRDGLKNGSISAETAKKALQEMANADYRFQNIVSAFAPVLDVITQSIKALEEFQKKAGAIGSTSMPGQTTFMPREGAQEETRRRAAKTFLDEQTALETRTANEKEIAALTEKLLKDAKEAGKAITDAEAAATARSIIEKREAAETRTSAANDIRKSLVDTAKDFSGFSENVPAQRNALQDFFKAANQNVDPKITAWCAAFVNAVLATNGLPSTGKLNARSFLDYGTATTEPKPGDLVILKRGSGNVQGHVGFFMGNDEGGGVRVLGGNQGDQVSEKTFKSEDVLGFRQVPGGSSDSLAQSVKLRQEQLKIIRETMAATAEETAGIAFETGTMSASNAEREKQRVIRETLLELEKQGVPITDELRAAVEAEAAARYTQVAAYDAAEQAADRLKEKQEELKAVQQEMSYAFQGALKGLISDLVHGKSATEALYNAVSQLADRLLDIALDQIFKSLFSGGAGAATGGGLFGGLFGFAAGGYTGDGSKNQPKGVVHGGEYVFSKKATNRIGVSNLEAMHKAAQRGYAEGGFVLPRIGAGGGVAQAGAAAPNVDARTTVINRFDASSFLSEALAHPDGAKTILNVIRAQPAVFRQALQG